MEMQRLECSTETKKKTIRYCIPAAATVLATAGWIMFLTGFGILYDHYRNLISSTNDNAFMYITHINNTMIPNWFVTFLFPVYIILLVLETAKEHWLLEAINNFIQATYILGCGSSMYLFGSYVAILVNPCSKLRAASSLGLAGIVITAVSMITVMVLTPTKKTILCNNSTTSGVDDTNTIETQKNEVYGLNLALPNDSATSSHDHQQRGQAYEEV